MYQNHPHMPGNRGPGDDLKGGFSSILAAMTALLLGAPFNALTVPYVIVLAEQTYAPEIVHLISLAWSLLSYGLVFFAARASIVAALTTAGMYLAYKLF